MSSFWKLKALVKKNFLEMRRNIFSTIFEIFLPIILISLFWLLKTAYNIDEIEFEKDEMINKNFHSFIDKRSIVNNNLDEQKSDSWEDLSPKETKIFENCKKFHYPQAPASRPKIGIVAPDFFYDIFEKKINIAISNSEFRELVLKKFTSVEEMENYVKNSREDRICFGISFDFKNDPKISIDATLHYFETVNYFGIFDSGTPDIPNSPDVLDEFQIGPNMKGYYKYQKNGYTYIQKLISESVLNYHHSLNKSNENEVNDVSINFGILPIKYEKYRLDEKFGEVIRILGPFFIVIAYLIPLMLYTYRMVVDKETKVKEGMKIMGLTDGVYFFSYFIQYLVISIFDTFLIAFIFYEIYTIIPYILFFIMFFLFSMNIFIIYK